MGPKNRLREDDQPQESTKGEHLKNLRTWKTKRIRTGSGRETVFPTGIKDSGIDNNGTFGDREEEIIYLDSFGNRINVDSDFICESYSELLITSPEERGICDSRFHPHLNRNILIGQDGHLLGDGRGVCEHCQKILTFIHIVVGILGLGVMLGIYLGFSKF